MAEMKYLLSSGKITKRPEEYIIDLFRLYLTIYPGDIPGNPDFGFDFNLAGVYKPELPGKVKSIVESLIRKINSRFNYGVSLSLVSLDLVDETKAKVVVSAGDISNEITINIYD